MRGISVAKEWSGMTEGDKGWLLLTRQAGAQAAGVHRTKTHTSVELTPLFLRRDTSAMQNGPIPSWPEDRFERLSLIMMYCPYCKSWA